MVMVAVATLPNGVRTVAVLPAPKTKTLDNVTAALRHALALLPADAPGAHEVRDALETLEGGETMVRVGRAAELLGVASPDTVKNWARAGRFSHVDHTEGGQWLFPLDEVLALRANRELQMARAKGRVPTPEVREGDPFRL